MNTWATSLCYWLVDIYALATVVLAAALAALWNVRQPARRLAVARWTLRVLLCVPVLAILAESARRTGPSPADPVGLCYCELPGATPNGRESTLVTTFAACSGLAVAWLALGAVARARLLARSAEAPASLQRLLKRVVMEGSTAPRLRVGGVSQPVALGVFRPTILLPDGFVEAETEAGVEAALTHEWAHLRRGDLRTLAASRLLLVVYFAHPLFYLFRGRLRADQEILADADAAGAGSGGNVAYAEALVGWARRTARRPFGPSLTLLGRSSMLRQRIALLLDAEFRVEPRCPRAWTVAVRVSAVALVIGLGVLASTGAARSAVSAVVPLTPRVVPHVHSAAPALRCPPDSDSPPWPGSCRPERFGLDACENRAIACR